MEITQTLPPSDERAVEPAPRPQSKLAFLFWQTLYQGYTLWGHVGSSVAGAINEVEQCLYQQMVWGRAPGGGLQQDWKVFQDPAAQEYFKKNVRTWSLVSAGDFVLSWWSPPVVGPVAKVVSHITVDRGAYMGGRWMTRTVWPYTGQPIFTAASKVKDLFLGKKDEGDKSRVPSSLEQRLFRVFQYGVRLTSLGFDLASMEAYFWMGFIQGQLQQYNTMTSRALGKRIAEEKNTGEGLSPLDQMFLNLSKGPEPLTPMDSEMGDFMHPQANRTGLVAAKIAGLALPFGVRIGVSHGTASLLGGWQTLKEAGWISQKLEAALPTDYLAQIYLGARRAGFNLNKRMIDGFTIGMQTPFLAKAVEGEAHRILGELSENSLLSRFNRWFNG